MLRPCYRWRHRCGYKTSTVGFLDASDVWIIIVLIIGWTMPETGRTVVGNGAVSPRGIWRTWLSYFRHSNPEHAGGRSSSELYGDINLGKTGVGVGSFPNLLSLVRLIFYADTFLTLWSAAAPYALWYCIQASIRLIYGQQYDYNSLAVSLCFLSGGSGAIAGGFIAGRLMDFNYKTNAEIIRLPIDPASGDDILNFPIEAA
jgi:hypothetical protein